MTRVKDPNKTTPRKHSGSPETGPPMPISSTAPDKTGFDKPLLYVTLALSFIGLIAVFSASAMEATQHYGNSLYFALRQLVFYIVGFGIMLGISRVPFFQFPKVTHIIAFTVIGLLLITLSMGVEAYGAERWIRIGGFQFQPSELGKISVLLLLAQALSTKTASRKSLKFLFNLALVGITLALIFKQPSLSMTIIITTVSLGLMFISGIAPWILTTVSGVTGAYAVYKIMHTEYQLRRIKGWINPWKDPQDTGYNLIQSYYAIGSGGFLGTGPGMSHQKLYYLPFQYTDFIFAVWAEEWGLVGSAVLIGLFVTLLYRGFVIARTCRSDYGQLLAMGITMILAIQMIINLSVAMGLFPVTGVTLPLVSYGGTSVLVTMAMIGVLLNISRYRVGGSTITDIRATR